MDKKKFVLTCATLLTLSSCRSNELSSSLADKNSDHLSYLRSSVQEAHQQTYNKLTELKSDSYDPNVLTVAAGVHSRFPSRSEGWQKVELPRPSEHAFYKKSISGHLLLPEYEQVSQLVIVFGSSFSTWSNGSWINEFAAEISTTESKRAILAFSGFLTEEWLAYDAIAIPNDNGKIAADLNQRIIAFVETLKNSHNNLSRNLNDIVLVGFSGGGSIALSLLANDQADIYRSSLLFSPILSMQAAANNLDGYHQHLNAKKSFFPKNSALTNGTFSKDSNLLWYMIPQLAQLKAGVNVSKDILLKAAKEPHFKISLTDHFMNEFVVVDAATVAISFPEKTFNQEISYSNLFLPLTNEPYKMLNQIQKPVLLVVSEDDPVLGEGRFVGNAKADLEEAYSIAEANEHVIFLREKRGGHMGYFLNNEWLSSVSDTFLKQMPHFR